MSENQKKTNLKPHKYNRAAWAAYILSLQKWYTSYQDSVWAVYILELQQWWNNLLVEKSVTRDGDDDGESAPPPDPPPSSVPPNPPPKPPGT